MKELRIYHNPRCSKSRQTLQLLEQHGHQPEIIEYLKDVPSTDDIRSLASMLGVSTARDMMRVKEPEYKEQNLADSAVTEEDLIAAMHQTPKLIERPIVVFNQQAKIGRPPEAVLELFE